MPLQCLAAGATREHHERGQVRIFAAQSIGDPCAHRRPSGLLVAGAHEGDRRIMIDRFGEHGPHDRDVVHDAPDVRNHRAQLDSGAAVAFEIEWRPNTAEHRLARRHSGDALALANAGGEFLTRHFLELRF